MIEALSRVLTDFANLLAGIAVLMVPAGLARLIWHGEQVRAGKRQWLGVVLLLEAATAALCAIVGAGVAEYWVLGPKSAAAVTGLCAWFGPSGLQALAIMWLQKRAAK